MPKNDPRFTKAEATYQAVPSKGAKCSGCKNFRQPDNCTVVKGVISPDGWCRLYDGAEEPSEAPKRSRRSQRMRLGGK